MSAYYSESFEEFLRTNDSFVRDQLSSAYANDRFNALFTAALDAWNLELTILRNTIGDIVKNKISAKQWSLLLEFWIPRRLKRIDAILLIDDVVVVLEFKSSLVNSYDVSQVEEYALDLANFHNTSHNRIIIPILIADSLKLSTNPSPSNVKPVWTCPPSKLSEVLIKISEEYTGNNSKLNIKSWEHGEYHPVPTILEAARAMFVNMEVKEIARAETDVHNLTTTIDTIRKSIFAARTQKKKYICFVTGVPGAGKTLAGLRLAHDPELAQNGIGIAFLSGNGPLVKVLQAALSEDQRSRNKILKKKEAIRDPKTLIQGVYSFKNDQWSVENPPFEQVIVYDEAQRAWDKKQNIKKLKGSKKCDYSEPALLMDIMSRHKEWAVIIALIGGGQEIHSGEAGLGEWGRSLVTHFPDWKVLTSQDALTGGDSTAHTKLFKDGDSANIHIECFEQFHLGNPTRQFRGQSISQFTNALIQGNSKGAKAELAKSPEFPITITRSLDCAKSWLRSHRRGLERMGLVASSGAGRLRPYGIETDNSFHKGIPIHHWFLREVGDIRSSNQLEVAATEFEIQGLELDWIGLCWGGDFLWDPKSIVWQLRNLSGNRWSAIHNTVKQSYRRNTYRVLLTRARQGMVIFVPPGSENDKTQLPTDFDPTYKFLLECGAVEIT